MNELEKNPQSTSSRVFTSGSNVDRRSRQTAKWRSEVWRTECKGIFIKIIWNWFRYLTWWSLRWVARSLSAVPVWFFGLAKHKSRMNFVLNLNSSDCIYESMIIFEIINYLFFYFRSLILSWTGIPLTCQPCRLPRLTGRSVADEQMHH